MTKMTTSFELPFLPMQRWPSQTLLRTQREISKGRFNSRLQVIVNRLLQSREAQIEDERRGGKNTTNKPIICGRQ